MCASFQIRGKTCKPGQTVRGAGPEGLVHHVWAGFARSEILSWWQKQGGVLIDLPATRFAERSEVTGKLIWDDIPDGLIIRGLLDIRTPTPLIKVVTRASSAAEVVKFQHPRMPVLERPLFGPVPPSEDDSEELDLFG